MVFYKPVPTILVGTGTLDFQKSIVIVKKIKAKFSMKIVFLMLILEGRYAAIATPLPAPLSGCFSPPELALVGGPEWVCDLLKINQ